MNGAHGASIDRLVAGDVGAAAQLSTSVGWNQAEADWERLVDLHPEGCFAARRDGALIGTATLVGYGDALAWLGMVIVRVDARGSGLGGRLVRAALDSWSTRSGGTVGLDATDLGVPLYRRLGFAEVATIERWSGAMQRPSRSPRGARTALPADAGAVAELDRSVTGVDRSRLLRRLIGEAGSTVVLVEEEGVLAGFGAVREGRERPHVGPVVGRDPGVLARALAAVSSVVAGRRVYLDAVRSDDRTAVLATAGLAVARSLTRMARTGTGAADRRAAALHAPGVLAATGFEWG